MASESTVFYGKLAQVVRNYPCLRQIPAQVFSRLQKKKKPFVLVPASEHSLVSEINAAVIRKLWVNKDLAAPEQQKQQENFVFCRFENVPRPILPWLHSGAHCTCVCRFPCTYATSVNIRYAYVYAYA